MGKAEVGSTKWVSNRMKAKGLTRLRWFCQICERPLRDENAFKLHVQSEGHVRKMLIVGEDPKKAINEYSVEFQKAFLQQLRTAHGEKAVNVNHFYQEYIADRFHIHMNATRWPSLTEFAKHLGREGLCRVEETEKGFTVAWIDSSPEALRRQEALRRKEAQDKGNEELEQRAIREQIRRANEARLREAPPVGEEAEKRELKRLEGEKITLSFGNAKTAPAAGQEEAPASSRGPDDDSASPADKTDAAGTQPLKEGKPQPEEKPKPAGGISLKMTAKPQPKNVFAQAKKNALAGGSKKTMAEQPKKMSEAERIMKEEMERKRSREALGSGGPAHKKQRTDFQR